MIIDRDIPYLGQCIQSLLNENILLHIFHGKDGDVAGGRVHGYGLGKQEYIGWVDPDDTIVPGAFNECISYIQTNPGIDGVYMYEQSIYNGKVVSVNKYPHHMTVVKRELIIPLFPKIAANPLNCERYVNEIKTLHCIPKIGYNHFIREDSFTKKKARK